MTWILIRGLARCAAHWGSFTNELEGRIKTGVIAVDLPGFGVHLNLPGPTAIEQMAQHVLTQIQQQTNSEEKFALLGISLGGMVAAEVAAMVPHQVRQMVLINTSARRFSPFYHRLQPTAYPQLVRALLSLSAESREPVLQALISNRPDLRQQTVAEWLAIQQQFPCKTRAIANQLTAAARYHGRPLNPCEKSLLLVSAGDRLVHPDCSIRMAEAWQVPLNIHPSAGHDLPLDDPEWVINCITRWLAY